MTLKTLVPQQVNTKNTHVIRCKIRGGPGLVLEHQEVPGPNRRYNERKQRL